MVAIAGVGFRTIFLTVFLTATVVLVRVVAVWAVVGGNVVVGLVDELAVVRGGGFVTRSTAVIAAAAAIASSVFAGAIKSDVSVFVDSVVGTFVDDAVVGPAITSAAASEVDGPGWFKQRSTAAAAAVMMICTIKGVVEVSAPVARSDDEAPSPSATVALDCEAVDDVGGVV